MNFINNTLQSFEPIGLSEMNKVSLLDRTDTKFIFHIQQLENILNNSNSNYRVLKINDLLFGRYETRYLDTNKFDFYIQHHNGRLNRYKLRFRTYLDSDKSFFEIKFKSNTNRTVKQRIELPEINYALTENVTKFLESKTNFKAEDMQETVRINYNRIMLVNKNFSERLSIDFNMHYTINNQEYGFPELVIAEVKQPRSGKSPFTDVMRQSRIKTLSISKYCLGMASFMPNIKTNAFKQKIHSINKLNKNYAN